jgi:SAM-dependent methyltransferase
MIPPLSTSNHKCRICGSDCTCHKIGRIINGYNLIECDNCGTIITESQPLLSDLKEEYDYLFAKGEYAQHRVEHQRLRSGKKPSLNFYRKRLLARAEKIIRGRSLFEIGGGTGEFGVIAKSRGWHYTNYDISDTAIQFCSELPLDTHKFELGMPPPLPARSADVVVAWEVIEHIWNIYEYFEVIKNALKSGGVFLFSTPNWLTPTYQKTDVWGTLGSPPIHINFFSVDSLDKTLQTFEYNSVEIIKRRLYLPNLTFNGIYKSLRFALFMDEPETLLGIAIKSA